MGIYDRDYMREGDEPADWWKPGYSIKRWLTIGIIAVSLLTSVVFLGRSIGIPKFFTSRATVTKHPSPLARPQKGFAACKYQRSDNRGASNTTGDRSGNSKIDRYEPPISKHRRFGEAAGNWIEAHKRSSAAD